MYYTHQSIEAVKEKSDIIEYIGSLVKLSPRGTGLCPFHHEKTGSFSVSKSRQSYKCFGCGAGGDLIQFIQEYHRLDFKAALEELARHYNTTLEPAKKEDQERHEKKRNETQLMAAVVKKTLLLYQRMLIDKTKSKIAWQYIQQRGYNEEIAMRWGMGYAPDAFNYITDTLIKPDVISKQPALDTGVISESNGKIFDFYRNRIIIPISDLYGNVIGMAGRWIPTGDEKKDSEAAKFFNPKESALYHKSVVWFGLFEALRVRAFKSKDGILPPAFILEGYFDVITWHECGIQTAISPGGTAITETHIQILKRYTNHVIIAIEDKAGLQVLIKSDSEKGSAIDLFIKAGFKTEIVKLFSKNEKGFIEKKDGHDHGVPFLKQTVEMEE